MNILSLDAIQNRIDIPSITTKQIQGFIHYSNRKVIMPPPGYFAHNAPHGSYHIKYGHLENDPFWVVKIAGGPHHLPIQGMMLAVDIQTGKPLHLLQDNGYLTSLRTAIAGSIAARCLAPKNVSAIGVLGTGTQARMQVHCLQSFTPCKRLYVWGRSAKHTKTYQREMQAKGYHVRIAQNPSEVAMHCNVIVTTTASTQPLLAKNDIQPGTHITAVGADSPGKIELDPELVASCHIIVADSASQCLDHGELASAHQQKHIHKDQVIELGHLLESPHRIKTSSNGISLCDLTGLAIQDIQIVKSILQANADDGASSTNHHRKQPAC